MYAYIYMSSKTPTYLFDKVVPWLMHAMHFKETIYLFSRDI